MNSSALIGGKFNLDKNPLQDLLSSVNAVRSLVGLNRTGHMSFLSKQDRTGPAGLDLYV